MEFDFTSASTCNLTPLFSKLKVQGDNIELFLEKIKRFYAALTQWLVLLFFGEFLGRPLKSIEKTEPQCGCPASILYLLCGGHGVIQRFFTNDNVNPAQNKMKVMQLPGFRDRAAPHETRKEAGKVGIERVFKAKKFIKNRVSPRFRIPGRNFRSTTSTIRGVPGLMLKVHIRVFKPLARHKIL
jgi:hypothetical protein